jgi:hypothetical protein
MYWAAMRFVQGKEQPTVALQAAVEPQAAADKPMNKRTAVPPRLVVLQWIALERAVLLWAAAYQPAAQELAVLVVLLRVEYQSVEPTLTKTAIAAATTVAEHFRYFAVSALTSFPVLFLRLLKPSVSETAAFPQLFFLPSLPV